MTSCTLEQAYLAIDAALVSKNQQGFLMWLSADHRTIMVDGTFLDYAHFTRPGLWDKDDDPFAAHIPHDIRIQDQTAVVLSRTYGVTGLNGRRIEIRGKCRDEWIWTGTQCKIRRRFKLEQSYFEGDQLILHRQLPAEVLAREAAPVRESAPARETAPARTR